MMKLQIIREMFQFLLERKKYWMIPLIVILILIGVLIIISEGSAIAPFIYTLF
jgi:hypothetical protein